ncbi:MAG: DUF5700 domain-containing putative Zn-dependent protease [Halanaerobiales bacterium]
MAMLYIPTILLNNRIEGYILSIKFIFDQVENALYILAKQNKNKTINKSVWDNLFSSEGYQLLVKREKDMGNELSKKDFKSFLLDERQLSNYENYMNTLKLLKDLELEQLLSKTKKYLPKKAKINTTIIPVIKPQNNSFVHEINDKLVLFIYLEPGMSRAKLENKLIHELHHIGFDDIYSPEKYKYLSQQTQKMIEWTNAFGEGFAMLAAAGGANIHPNKFDEGLKEKWDSNIKKFNKDFELIENFFVKILKDKFSNEKELYNRGYELMVNNGGQGSWYTVGWKIAVVIEKIKGKEVLFGCMSDLTYLYPRYNEAVKDYNKKYNENLKSWSDKIINSF